MNTTFVCALYILDKGSVCFSNQYSCVVHLFTILLKFFNPFSILYFNGIIAHLCSNWPLMCFSLLDGSLKKAEKGRNMYEVYHTLYIIVSNYSTVVGIYTVELGYNVTKGAEYFVSL
jgi:hypothetical protein